MQKALVSIACLGRVTKHQSIQVTISCLGHATKHHCASHEELARVGTGTANLSSPTLFRWRDVSWGSHGAVRLNSSLLLPSQLHLLRVALLAVAESQKPSSTWERHRCYFRWMDSRSKAGQVQSPAPLKS